MTDQPLPQSLQVGDFIYIHDHGAYSTAHANTLNDCPIPKTVVVNADSPGARFALRCTGDRWLEPRFRQRPIIRNAIMQPFNPKGKRVIGAGS